MSDIKQSYLNIMDDHYPDEMTISFGGSNLFYKKRKWKIDDDGILIERGLRYGENPGQEAALFELVNGNLTLGGCQFITPGNSLVSGITESDMIQSGKHPGKINLTDIDSGLNILKYLTNLPSVVIMKHNNPCGAACAETISKAFSKAYMADRIASFGGCVALNRTVDKITAELISQEYFEVVVAPDFAEGVIDILKRRKNLRIVKISKMDNLEKYKTMRFIDFKSLIDGGIIVQQSPVNIVKTKDDLKPAESEYKGTIYKIDRMPSEKEYQDLIFGWFIEQGVTSNSVLFVKDLATVGIGTGEQDRVGVAEIAIQKAYTKYADRLCFERYKMSFKELQLKVIQKNESIEKLNEINMETKNENGGLRGTAMVSDAFFPFRDGVDVGINQGVSSIVQPGGSVRDFESIVACNEANPKVAMVYTGQRAFKH